MKILLADDHALFREGMRHVLIELDRDVQIVEASDCAHALEAVEAHPDISLVLLDLSMPGAGGFAALEVLTREQLTLPIVVLSGSENRADMQRALESGAMGFIPKSATAPACGRPARGVSPVCASGRPPTVPGTARTSITRWTARGRRWSWRGCSGSRRATPRSSAGSSGSSP